MNKITLSSLFLIKIFSVLLLSVSLRGDDFITIDNPINTSYGIVSGEPLIMSGSSSQPNMIARLFINTTETSSAPTDAYGNWNLTSPYLANGTYTLTARLTSPDHYTLAVDQTSFTVENPETITITNPSEGAILSSDPITLSGTASLPSATVHISLDGTLVATTTTDATGDWQTSYVIDSAINGTHTFLVELLESGYPVASASVDSISSIPLLFPTGISQMRFINGDIPTSGSGSGPGYSYSVSGSTITINFNPAFSTSPSLVATGLCSTGSSTVSLSAISAAAAALLFSSGTERVHFSASALQ